MAFSLVAGAITALTGSALIGNVVAAAAAFGLQSAINRKYTNRHKKRAYSAFSQDVQVGGDLYREASFGRTLTAGHLLNFFVWGPGDKYNAEVIQLSDFRCDGLEPYVVMDGRKISLIEKDIIGGEAAHYEMEGYEGLASIRFYDGRPGQVADAKLIADTASLSEKWTSDHRCTGLCYVVFEITYSSKWERIPAVKWALGGLWCYDPRKDDTVSGGAGPHRLDDPETWEYSTNPAIQRLNYLLGYKAPLSGRTIIGSGKSLAQIDLNSHIAAANAADAIRSNGKKTYEASLIANSGDDHSELLKEFDDALAGYGANRSGLAAIIAGAPQLPVLDIVPDNLRTNAGRTTQGKKPSRSLFNVLTGQYTNIEAMFEPTSLKPVRVNADIAADKRTEQHQNDFLQVTDPDQAQYLLQIRYRQNRLGGMVRLPVTDDIYFRLNAGDWVTFDGKTWMVSSKESFELELTETRSDIYSEAGIPAGPIAIAPAIPLNPSLISQIQGLAASAGFVGGSDGSQNPALEVTWTPPEDPTITGIQIRYVTTNTDTPEAHTITAPDPEAGRITIDHNVLGGRIYDVSALIITQPDRFRLTAGPINTAVPTIAPSVALANLQSHVLEIYERIWDRDRAETSAIIESIEAHDARILSDHLERRRIEKRVDTGNADLTASIEELETIRITESEAVALQLSSLDAAYKSSDDEIRASVEQESAARADAISAEANARTQAIANIDTKIAEGLFDVEAVAGDNTFVRLALMARIQEGDALQQTGLLIEVIDNGNGTYTRRILMDAAHFVLTDGANDKTPFQILDGTVNYDGAYQSSDGDFYLHAGLKIFRFTV